MSGGGIELGKNINFEDVSKVKKTQASNRSKTGERMSLVDSPTDWKPMEQVQKQANMFM